MYRYKSKWLLTLTSSLIAYKKQALNIHIFRKFRLGHFLKFGAKPRFHIVNCQWSLPVSLPADNRPYEKVDPFELLPNSKGVPSGRGCLSRVMTGNDDDGNEASRQIRDDDKAKIFWKYKHWNFLFLLEKKTKYCVFKSKNELQRWVQV